MIPKLSVRDYAPVSLESGLLLEVLVVPVLPDGPEEGAPALDELPLLGRHPRRHAEELPLRGQVAQLMNERGEGRKGLLHDGSRDRD